MASESDDGAGNVRDELNEHVNKFYNILSDIERDADANLTIAIVSNYLVP